MYLMLEEQENRLAAQAAMQQELLGLVRELAKKSAIDVSAFSSSALRNGWLHKQGVLNTAFRNRYFVLEERTLSYYERPGSPVRGSMLVVAAPTVLDQPSTPGRFAFEVPCTNPNTRWSFTGAPQARALRLEASSDEERKGWMESLAAAIREEDPQ